ncbi:four-carbon acid sugar kinase family protein [Sinorhizobium fredii]|uniref:Four-carbon acid sugar kinase family protein n=1 Tax=Rhizobium fredii TaxID=380 RepID=A0A844AIQ0_RHIFR|nr:four-carbon acid sugar kinase family protein [Sinorhizobium fredii]AWM26517.1 putative type III effector Hop protein [Sinorhizobium fredii CCBAU 25509]MQW96116.1 four-carbon acid sugar kinase family protein [Sinorhizobium fredii]MQX11838.1 four-carbon acid sugar kinase family protein [Sinorhizobium fredii]GEC32083.1 membrane protein [Sinorhizobium fredii]GLS07816.1 membrane protein [Sinorhizobium fredii]
MAETIDQIKHIGVVADDLTSAADGAIAFLKRGYVPRICRMGSDNTHASLVSIDTGSRALDETDAAHVTRQAVTTLADRTFLYKTIDSTLRGHIRVEIAAAFVASGRPRLVIAPAFPAAGRTTIDGIQLLHGEPVAQTAYSRDPVHPARTSRIEELIEPGLGRIARVSTCTEDGDIGNAIGHAPVVIIDACDQVMLNRRVAEIQKHGPVLWVGSPGMAEALATVVERRTGQHTFTPEATPRRVLVLVGSANPVSHSQCDALAATGASVAMSATDIDEAASVVCIRTPHIRTSDPAKALATLVDEAEIALLRHRYDAVVATGGETMHALLERLSIHAFDLIRELEPGFPLGCARLADGRMVLLAMKAGGFGSAMTLRNAADIIRRIGKELA